VETVKPAEWYFLKLESIAIQGKYCRQETPVFSVIIPTFNRDHLLLRAISSVFYQSFISWELIVVDDGSVDSTWPLIRGLLDQGHRIRYYQQPKNQGAAAARNMGISIARGEYLAFLDSDDFFKEDHLANRFQLFLRPPEPDLIYGGAEINGEKNVVCYDNPEKLISLELPEVRIGGTFTLKTSAARILGGFPLISYGEDVQFFENAVRAGWCIAYDPRKTYVYDRTRADSITIQRLKKKTA
jgi:glycosyltransferase involved in cell wall biosynthesis